MQSHIINMQSHISYEQLLEIISWAVFTKPVKNNQCQKIDHLKPIEGAEYGGIYIGSPGKDIYKMLPFLNESQMKKVAQELANKFPFIPPAHHVQYSACIRFIYGQFEKQGVLRSKKDFIRMKKKKIDWKLPRLFLEFLYKEFEKNENYYGLGLISELEAHRLGDEAIIYKNDYLLNKMEEVYNKSFYFFNKCKSYKHLFSIYYWCSQYFKESNNYEKTIKYSKLAIKKACKYYHKYFPYGEKYYSKRLLVSLFFIKKHDKDNWNNFYDKYIKNIKNLFLKENFKKIEKKMVSNCWG